jgi:hypothetical protein
MDVRTSAATPDRRAAHAAAIASSGCSRRLAAYDNHEHVVVARSCPRSPCRCPHRRHTPRGVLPSGGRRRRPRTNASQSSADRRRLRADHSGAARRVDLGRYDRTPQPVRRRAPGNRVSNRSTRRTSGDEARRGLRSATQSAKRTSPSRTRSRRGLARSGARIRATFRRAAKASGHAPATRSRPWFWRSVATEA